MCGQVLFAGVHVAAVPRRFRPPVSGIVLGGCDHLKVPGILALHPRNKRDRKSAGQVRVLPIRFLTSAQRGSRKILMFGDQKVRP
jgi:hypothetical protein